VKHIDRMVTTYIREECDKLPHLSKSLNPDLKAIAIDGSAQNIIKVMHCQRIGPSKQKLI
jgi:protein HOOK3